MRIVADRGKHRREEMRGGLKTQQLSQFIVMLWRDPARGDRMNSG